MAKVNATIDKFKCPEGFSTENVVSQLYFEDIDDDCELWLLGMPHGLEPSNFEDAVISLDKSSNTLRHKEKNTRKYRCIALPSKTGNLCMILPKKDNGTLTGVKKHFEGSIFITDEEPWPGFESDHDNEAVEEASGNETYVHSRNLGEANASSSESSRTSKHKEKAKQHKKNSIGAPERESVSCDSVAVKMEVDHSQGNYMNSNSFLEDAFDFKDTHKKKQKGKSPEKKKKLYMNVDNIKSEKLLD